MLVGAVDRLNSWTPSRVQIITHLPEEIRPRIIIIGNMRLRDQQLLIPEEPDTLNDRCKLICETIKNSLRIALSCCLMGSIYVLSVYIVSEASKHNPEIV